MKVGIFSFYMENTAEILPAQKAVVDKFNKSKHDFHQIKTEMRHGFSMDACWHLNNCQVRPEFRKMAQKWDYDVIFFLDSDAIPLNDRAIDSYAEQAYNGILVGNIQRTNHLQNNQHVFVAPSAMAISVETFWSIGKPSAIETSRSDVAEEYTWLVERKGVNKVKFYMPLRFDRFPEEAPTGWALADGMPRYGLGTTFGLDGEGETFFHNFQGRFPGQPEHFIKKCQEILGA
jgi:hypothetical protein